MKHFLRNLCSAALAAAMLLSLAVGAFAQEAKTLLQIDPDSVTSVAVQDGSTGRRYDVTDSEQAEKLVEALNSFTYTTSHPVDAGGWSYRIQVQTGTETVDVILSASSVNLDGEVYVNENAEPLTDAVALIETIFAENNMYFSDVTKDNWYYGAVTVCTEKQIVSGYTEDSFCPNKFVTRAEAAKMMVLAAGLEIDESATLTFTDCYANWYVPYVAAAVEAGMINGYEDGTFHPNASITRAELAALICQSLKLSSTDGAVSFKDVSADAWYADEVAMASAAGCVSGDAGTGLYRPEDSVTRAELAQVVYNIYLK